jgi:hypothetical protein
VAIRTDAPLSRRNNQPLQKPLQLISCNSERFRVVLNRAARGAGGAMARGTTARGACFNAAGNRAGWFRTAIPRTCTAADIQPPIRRWISIAPAEPPFCKPEVEEQGAISGHALTFEQSDLDLIIDAARRRTGASVKRMSLSLHYWVGGKQVRPRAKSLEQTASRRTRLAALKKGRAAS